MLDAKEVLEELAAKGVPSTDSYREATWNQHQSKEGTVSHSLRKAWKLHQSYPGTGVGVNRVSKAPKLVEAWIQEGGPEGCSRECWKQDIMKLYDDDDDDGGQ